MLSISRQSSRLWFTYIFALASDALSIAGGWRKCDTLLIFLSNHCTVVTLAARKRSRRLEWTNSPWHASQKTQCWATCGKPRARNAGYGPAFPVIFPFTLPDSSVRVAPRSLTCNKRWSGRQQRLGCLHVRWCIVDPLSVSLDTIRAWHLLAATTVHLVHFATHRSAKNRSTTIAPNFSFRAKPWRRSFLTLTLSETSSATQVYTALALTGIAITHSSGDRSLQVASRSLAPSGITITRSEWHHDRSLRVASQSLAVLDFRQLQGSNSQDFNSLKIHLGMEEDFSAKQQSELQNNFGRRPSLFRLRRQSKWENDWGRTLKCNRHVFAANGREANSGRLRHVWRFLP